MVHHKRSKAVEAAERDAGTAQTRAEATVTRLSGELAHRCTHPRNPRHADDIQGRKNKDVYLLCRERKTFLDAR